MRVKGVGNNWVLCDKLALPEIDMLNVTWLSYWYVYVCQATETDGTRQIKRPRKI